MEIWEIKLWEDHPENEKEKDVILITKEHDDADFQKDGPAILQNLFAENPHIEAVVDGMDITVPADKTQEAVTLLGKHAIPSCHLGLAGVLTRDQYMLSF